MKNVLIISSSPRKNGNSQMLCEEFKRGAEEKGNSVELIRLSEKKIGYCRACNYCMKNNGACVLKDDMADVLKKFINADVLVLATPVYFYGICAQMKAECQSNLDSEKRRSSSLIWQVGCSVYYDTTFMNLCNLSAILFVTRERLLGIGLLLGGFYVKTQTSDDGGSSKDHAKA